MTAVNLNRAIRGPVTAVPIVAGKGVRLVKDTVNNRLVLEADETVLYIASGSTGVDSCTLSEAASNFEYIDFIVGYNTGDNGISVVRFPGSSTKIHIIYGAGIGTTDYLMRVYGTISGTSVTLTKSKCTSSAYTSTSAESIRNNNSGDLACIFKVVGVNRIASN